MIRERVATFHSKKPIILITPNGAEYPIINHAAEYIIKALNINGVLNRGFEKSDVLNVDKDLADCSRIDHIVEPIVYDEFLKPILKIRNRAKLEKTIIFYLCVVDNSVHRKANEEVDLIIGCGRGRVADSFTCKPWRRNLFTDLWRKFSNDGEVYEGKGTGDYAGRNSNHINQYFRKYKRDMKVESMILNIPLSGILGLKIGVTQRRLCKTIDQFMSHVHYGVDTQLKFI